MASYSDPEKLRRPQVGPRPTGWRPLAYMINYQGMRKNAHFQ